LLEAVLAATQMLLLLLLLLLLDFNFDFFGEKQKVAALHCTAAALAEAVIITAPSRYNTFFGAWMMLGVL
jgi:hypothetical protein